ncbi:heat-inducible transcription repressor HrcA [Labedella gwakjiensis]|uniref:Heat-inducible transcription repressor HrcA n=1 Tax=Labedella gwakjiensis TaxID=390269 RepID=A0A2P8H086_9MICO|nr:heat-inducible transcriptional repressor HrcA [Labedella gwakjiensis]PSL39631.1 heat-inducible transcription repressor HrcA [Labedella gwakjiensis]RUQ85980.1 heat-inducible transcriptional repressor HrcA [Labedella gwakjiensis]
MVSERGLDVLRAIVHDYVASREPVGSKSIVDRHAFGVSAATIRNDMALLEEEELIVAPHTSSGRVPTDKGYRLFVDQLADRRPLSSAQRVAIEQFLGESVDLDDVLSRTVRLLSQLTNQVAIVQYPTFSKASVRHVELVTLAPSRLLAVLITDSGRVEQRVIETGTPVDAEAVERLRTAIGDATVGFSIAEAAAALEKLPNAVDAPDRDLAILVTDAVIGQLGHHRQDRLVLAGSANLARTEDDFRGSIFPVLEALEQQVVLLRLFGEMQSDAFGVTARIGRENAAYGLAETSVVVSDYSTAGETARLGVLGPTRMDYSNNMAAVRAVARYLTRLLGES